MTDNDDHRSNPFGPATPLTPGGLPPQGPYQAPVFPETVPPPIEYPAWQPQQPVQQYYSEPAFTGQQPVPANGPSVAPSPTKRIWLAVAAVTAAIVLVGGGTAVYALTRHSGTSTSAASVGAAPTSKAGTTSAVPSASGAPKPGSRTVVVPTLGVSYDVPSGWTIASPAETSGQSGPDGELTGYGKSSEGSNYCPGSAYRSLAFVAQLPTTDLATAATKVAWIAIEGGYDDPTGGRPGTPTPVTTASGISGKRAEASGPWKPTLPGCTTTGYSVYTFAFPGPRNSTLVMAVLADRGTVGELPAEQAEQMIASIRIS
ncbi:hypothetical protein GPX89_09490 [Nocardia sp. ET3-3]|uniref:DUF8017 domain-containing protein n=1 Tax=Nocardia terrae TaxID=2675851 RepID=A0A7K1UT13_9NOCA|nr:hypothetical protein [Nocardia terrae]MVU77480.1 hypothetical protein [Nocardia terrae]